VTIQSHEDPEVRAQVFATVTYEEARRILRSKAGKPWCDALMAIFCSGLTDDPEIKEPLVEAARMVRGLRPDQV
jgi:hypothetical protein